MVPFDDKATVLAIKIAIDATGGSSGQIVPKSSYHGAGAHSAGQAKVSEFGISGFTQGDKAIGTNRDLVVVPSIKLKYKRKT